MKSNKLKAGEHQRLSSILSPVDGLDYVSVVIPLSIDSRSRKGLQNIIVNPPRKVMYATGVTLQQSTLHIYDLRRYASDLL